jgi:hypothetical protein
MCEYTGENDPTRLNATEWYLAEYAKALSKNTTETFTSLDEELQPYSLEKLGPTLSFQTWSLNCLAGLGMAMGTHDPRTRRVKTQ